MLSGNDQEALAFTLDSNISFLRPSCRGNRKREQRRGEHISAHLCILPCPRGGLWISGQASFSTATSLGEVPGHMLTFKAPTVSKTDCQTEDRRGLGTVVPKDFSPQGQEQRADTSLILDASSEEAEVLGTTAQGVLRDSRRSM